MQTCIHAIKCMQACTDACMRAYMPTQLSVIMRHKVGQLLTTYSFEV